MFKVKFREIVNSAILNDDNYVGFLGDSEYVDEAGNIIMGYWEFCHTVKKLPKNKKAYKLDDYVEVYKLHFIPKGECYFVIENDNEEICLVRFIYDE